MSNPTTIDSQQDFLDDIMYGRMILEASDQRQEPDDEVQEKEEEDKQESQKYENDRYVSASNDRTSINTINY